MTQKNEALRMAIEALEIGAQIFGNNSIYQKPLEACKTALAEPDLPDDRLETLLYAVETKHPNETRFETALRYIQSAEKRTCTASQAAPILNEVKNKPTLNEKEV